MKRFRWVLVLIIAALIAVMGFVFMRNNRRSAVEKYKAELRAKGEKISFAELGFPRQPENPEGLQQLTNAVKRLINNNNFNPGEITAMQFVAPGKARVNWRSQKLMLGSGQTTNWISWEALQAQMVGASNELIDIHTAVKQPIRVFMFDPEQTVMKVQYPFIQMRSVVQWLHADCVSALHEGDRSRALRDIHTLMQLTEFNKEDPALAAQMIRVAFARLGLSVTWEALQNSDWTEGELTEMRKDLEHLDLSQVFEIACLGERASAEMIFNKMVSGSARLTIAELFPSSGKPTIRYHVRNAFTAAVWQLNSDKDELFALKQFQDMIECARNARLKSWPDNYACLTNQMFEMNEAFGSVSGLGASKYLISACCLPSSTRAFRSIVHNETLRRLTITAIALKRFQLRHKHIPSALNELVPEFISAVPIDPMNIQPLRYKLNTDGMFVLYSVGEDGKDDGGDPTPTDSKSPPDLWNARDAVWPVAEENSNIQTPTTRE